MKKVLLATVALIALPVGAQAQSLQSMFTPRQTDPGFYLGVEGGLNWLINSGNYDMDTGFAVGGVVGYDFVGPRVELEGVYRSNTARGTANFGNVFSNTSGDLDQFSSW